MNFQQLEYLVALDKHRHFVKAADACSVTQPTLSMAIKALEEELQLTIVQRGVQPLHFTAEGNIILQQAKEILAQQRCMLEISEEISTGLKGKIRLSAIPTIAPYALPRFLSEFQKEVHQLELTVKELPTRIALQQLKEGEIDFAILATDVDTELFQSTPLYAENLYAYLSPNQSWPKNKWIQPSKIQHEAIWLLSEEHCFREQALEICSLRGSRKKKYQFDAGSLEGIIRMIDLGEGLTILPEMACTALSTKQKKNLREFAPPSPARTIRLVYLKNYPRLKVIAFLSDLLRRR
jgi:LysR family hydrogen peroxide-inducible transcriptional activator